jgi:hypothetical protein
MEHVSSTSADTKTKTLYLDTANWNVLAEGKVDAAPLLRAVERGRYVPVLSYVHLAEFARKKEPYRSRVVALAEKFRVAGNLRWIRSAKQLLRAEAERAFLSWRGLAPSSSLDAFGASFPDVAEHELSWADKASQVLDGVPQMVDLIARGGTSLSLESLRDQYPTARRLVRKRRVEHQRFPVGERRAWVAARLTEGQALLSPAGILFVPPGEDLAAFREELDLSLCPGNKVVQAFHEGWNLSTDGEAPSDLEDEIHVLGLVYCDVAFADKRTCDALLKGGWPAEKLPLRNGEFRKWVAGLDDESREQ